MTDSTSSSTRANQAARVVAIVVFVLGALIVIKPALDHADAVWKGDPFARELVTTTVTKSAARKTERITTRRPASDSFVERALGASGLLVVRFGMVALAAFLAGAVVQRTVMAKFAIKIAGLEVPDLQETARSSEEAIEKLTKRLKRLTATTREQQEEIGNLKAGAAKDVEHLAYLAGELAAVARRLDEGT